MRYARAARDAIRSSVAEDGVLDELLQRILVSVSLPEVQEQGEEPKPHTAT